MAPGAHREIVLLTRAGMSVERVSQLTGVPVEAIKVIVRSPMGRAEIARAS